MSIYKPSGVAIENIDFRLINGTTGVLASGTLSLVGIDLPFGLTVSTLYWFSGATALVNGTTPHYWTALFDKNLNLLAQSTDNIAKTIAGTTLISDALSAPVTTTRAGHFFVGIMVNSGTGGTQPTYAQFSGASAVMGTNSSDGAKFNGTSTTGLAGVAPSTAAAIAQVGNMPWAGVS